MLRPSFVPPRPIRVLRDLTRYRIDLVAARTAEKNRVEKLLEDACIKLSVVASDIFGVSGRAMLASLIAGERDPKVIADLARSRMRAKIKLLEEAFAGLPAGGFDDHHRFLLERMLGRIDAVDADIAVLDAQIEAQLAPFDQAVQRLDEIPGIGPVAAAIIIAEIGLDMTRFPTAGHLCSWAKFSPGIKSSAGKSKGSGSTGHGNRYLARVLGEAAVMAGRSDTFLGQRYRRIARRRGKKKAIVAVGRSMLVIIWHLLADRDTRFHDLGVDHFARNVNTAARLGTVIFGLVGTGVSLSTGYSTTGPMGDVEDEAQDHEGPSPAVHSGDRAVSEDVEQGRVREEDQAEQGNEEGVVGAVHQVREDPDEHQCDPRSERGEQGEQTSHLWILPSADVEPVVTSL
jgi:transposase